MSIDAVVQGVAELIATAAAVGTSQVPEFAEINTIVTQHYPTEQNSNKFWVRVVATNTDVDNIECGGGGYQQFGECDIIIHYQFGLAESLYRAAMEVAKAIVQRFRNIQVGPAIFEDPETNYSVETPNNAWKTVTVTCPYYYWVD